jgi:heme exporter protein CcmD
VNADAHWGYIAAAYLATFVSVGVLVWRIVGEHRRLTAELSRFKDDGAER